MKFRKKPIVIEAEQFQGIEHGLPKGVKPYRAPGNRSACEQCDTLWTLHGSIETLEGWMTVCIGDWIIQGIQGELYLCKPDIFAATYEIV